MGSSTVFSNFRHLVKNIFIRNFMFGMVGSLSLFVTSWESADRMKDRFLSSHREYGETYDFIVVGGGTAGCIVADRLTKAQYKVLVLEDGGEPHPFQSIPLISSNYMSNYKQLDWMHSSVVQPWSFYSTEDQKARISQGRGLGGTGNLDYMMYLRGHPDDYDEWAKVLKDPSWKYESLMEHFKQLESYTGSWDYDKELHGNSGPLRIRRSGSKRLGKLFCKACREMGFNHVDLNGYHSQGYDYVHSALRRGKRLTTYEAFLKNPKTRWNLIISKYSHVNKVMIDPVNRTAYAVEYDKHGEKKVAYATKEVIISSGAIQTPKILMMSGIGAKEDLEALRFPVVQNLPVGNNLQDQVALMLGPFMTKEGTSLLLDRDVSSPSFFRYTRNKGPLTNTGFSAILMPPNLSNISGSGTTPNVQLSLHALGHHATWTDDFSHAHNLNKEMIGEFFDEFNNKDSFSILVTLTRPRSRGTVKLVNADPYSPTIINPRYFENRDDLSSLIKGIQQAIFVVEGSKHFSKIEAKYMNKELPLCSRYPYKSVLYWECYIRTMAISVGHVGGTAPMGTVLDSKLKVRGVQNLRVMDASAMPNMVSSSPAVATMVIAEKGVKDILNEWGVPEDRKNYFKESRKIMKTLSHIKNQVSGISNDLTVPLKALRTKMRKLRLLGIAKPTEDSSLLSLESPEDFPIPTQVPVPMTLPIEPIASIDDSELTDIYLSTLMQLSSPVESRPEGPSSEPPEVIYIDADNLSSIPPQSGTDENKGVNKDFGDYINAYLNSSLIEPVPTAKSSPSVVATAQPEGEAVIIEVDKDAKGVPLPTAAGVDSSSLINDYVEKYLDSVLKKDESRKVPEGVDDFLESVSNNGAALLVISTDDPIPSQAEEINELFAALQHKDEDPKNSSLIPPRTQDILVLNDSQGFDLSSLWQLRPEHLLKGESPTPKVKFSDAANAIISQTIPILNKPFKRSVKMGKQENSQGGFWPSLKEVFLFRLLNKTSDDKGKSRLQYSISPSSNKSLSTAKSIKSGKRPGKILALPASSLKLNTSKLAEQINDIISQDKIFEQLLTPRVSKHSAMITSTPKASFHEELRGKYRNSINAFRTNKNLRGSNETYVRFSKAKKYESYFESKWPSILPTIETKNVHIKMKIY